MDLDFWDLKKYYISLVIRQSFWKGKIVFFNQRNTVFLGINWTGLVICSHSRQGKPGLIAE